MTRSNKYRVLIIAILIVIIAAGSIVTWASYRQSQPVEISISPAQELRGEIDIDGAVNNPGLYPLRSGNSLEELIQAAGGASAGADLNRLKLYISEAGEEGEPSQKINLNKAETWLLQALPEIGETRAQAILDYRQQNGRFDNINELIEVEGIGPATYEKIKDLITVSD